MRYIPFLTLFVIAHSLGVAQTKTPEQILSASIAYHDPNGVWGSLQGSFTVRMDSPDREPRVSEITLDQQRSRFRLHVTQGSDTKTYELNGDECALMLNGSASISAADAETHRLTCERATMYRNYYSYLYGLPMKLRDKGTTLSPVAERRTFHGKEYLVLKATYDQEVGQDTWYFYFDPESYAMEAYQFYHDEAKNDGEYILLKDIETIEGIKMPKIRAWYYNKNDAHLGTDTLLEPGSF